MQTHTKSSEWTIKKVAWLNGLLSHLLVQSIAIKDGAHFIRRNGLRETRSSSLLPPVSYEAKRALMIFLIKRIKMQKWKKLNERKTPYF